ncbi:MAG: hypothetical protein IPK39_18490 [Sulfuritalea sp.]|nr:hypothetical protein [Sulfuritalea sp.]
MGLVYTSLRSVVALLSLSITVLKALGGCNQIQPILLNLVVSALRTFLRYLTTENMCSVGLVAAINQKGAPLST